MARIRSIKPDYWKSEAIARLPLRCRLTFIALWSYVDDNGVGRDNEKLIAAELYPLEEDPRKAVEWIREDLATLARESRVTRYMVDGRPFLAVTNWDEHQKIDRPNKARYPGPDDPAAVPLTCDDAPIRATLAQPSRVSRADSSPGAVEQGAGSSGELPSSPATADDAFGEFWIAYPRKVGRQAARKAWDKALRATTATVILKAVVAYRDDPNQPDDRTLIPHPATWLNEGRWDDEPLPPRVPRSAPWSRIPAGQEHLPEHERFIAVNQ